ncbi:hypothetical protein B0H66DRAFT_642772 [Apodospora peruviana]|uniref:NACHT domain-containing protein n=1 Tax=Apodospora peruviana TaxID=516989 RepID=A0AAE0I0Z2_9PEZI|nr:hypothetical protein B0H66DRAFT_642772 [Apodospora peruviana]
MTHHPTVDEAVKEIEQLAQECHKLCISLLDVVKRFRVEGTPRRPARSFLQAVKTTWGCKNIKGLENRIARYQRASALHFLPLLSEMRDCTLRTLDTLKGEALRLRLDQESRFDELAKQLRVMPTNRNHTNAGNPVKPTDDDIETIENGVSALSLAESSLSFIAEHDETRKSLKTWAGPKRLIIAEHYFWTGGAAIQQLYEGLLRSLLYDIFRLSPNLIPLVCHVRWSTAVSGDSSSYHKEWTTRELGDILSALAHQTDTPARYCFFVDGLDEYDGEHFEVCKILKHLASSPNIKCCLSSRPWNVFEDAFGTDSTQRLDSTTGGARSASPTVHMKEVVDTITDRAHGVFLWGFLVTRPLRDGLANGDTITDLKERLVSFPSDLEPFFKHMLDVVDPFYHRSMARVLLLAVKANQSMTLKLYHVQEYEMQDKEWMPSLTNAVDGSTLGAGGLLEVKEGRVEFLHRTVREFLRTREMDDYLRQKSGTDFKPNLSTLKGFIFLLRCWLGGHGVKHLSEKESFWRECLMYANAAIGESEEEAMKQLDAIEGLYNDMDFLYNDMDFLFNDMDFLYNDMDFLYNDMDISGGGLPNFRRWPTEFRFRYELILAGIDKYISVKLRQETISFYDNIHESPLYRAISRMRWYTGHISIAAQLLEAGIDPNSRDESEQPWHLFIHFACAFERTNDNFQMVLESSLFSLFLRNGAERCKPVRLSSYPEWVLEEYGMAGAGLGHADLTSHLHRRHGAKELLPCTHFLVAIFNHHWSHKFSNECVRIMESFLDCADEKAKLQVVALVAALVPEFRKLGPTEPGRLQFFYRITQKIITIGVKLEADLDVLIPYLELLFKNTGGGHLVEMIRQNSTSAYPNPVSTPLKRGRTYIRPRRQDKRAKIGHDTGG